MVEYYSVDSYEQFLQNFAQLSKRQNRVLTLFCGALNSTGSSWCPDCRNVRILKVYPLWLPLSCIFFISTVALPVIQHVIQNHSDLDVPLIYIFVGIERDEWKNMSNRYRRDDNLRLTNVPTLICWEKGREVARLVDQECSVPELIEPFFKSRSL